MSALCSTRATDYRPIRPRLMYLVAWPFDPEALASARIWGGDYDLLWAAAITGGEAKLAAGTAWRSH